MSTAWPSLPLEEWQATRDTLHLWSQVVGKVRLAHTPLVNHWWNSTLYVTARGLRTSLVPHPERPFQIDFDLTDHRLDIVVADGPTASVPLVPMTVAAFYAEVMDRLAELGLATPIWPVPVEIEGTIPFDRDTTHASYDPDHAHRFWQQLVQAHRVFSWFRAGFVGKVSPIHLFFGAFDLAVTRFSGRTAPLHPGGAPNCGPQVMWEAYSHEVSSCGFWPGGGGEGLFYSYVYPEPPGFAERPTVPDARYDAALGEFVLPYESVRQAEEPGLALLEFLQRTYEAAADLAAWDRAALERR